MITRLQRSKVHECLLVVGIAWCTGDTCVANHSTSFGSQIEFDRAIRFHACHADCSGIGFGLLPRSELRNSTTQSAGPLQGRGALPPLTQ